MSYPPSKLYVRLLGHCRTRDPGVKVEKGREGKQTGEERQAAQAQQEAPN